MNSLIIVSGPSGVGKGTLVDKVLKEFPKMQFLKKDFTRVRRPDDRDAEGHFWKQEEHDERKSKFRTVLGYDVRGNGCGLPVESLSELKDNPRIMCLSDFDLIRSLSDMYDTTTIYVTAPVDVIKQRLNDRLDTPEQRKKSIESVEKHLQEYEENKDLFDYEITNESDLESAQNEIVEVVKEELSLHRKVYYGFLVSKYEVDGCVSLPDPSGIAEDMKDIATLSMSNEVSQKACSKKGIYQFVGNSVGIRLSTIEDKERKSVFYGRFTLEGPKNKVTKTAALLEKRFPILSEYGRKQERIECN